MRRSTFKWRPSTLRAGPPSCLKAGSAPFAEPLLGLHPLLRPPVEPTAQPTLASVVPGSDHGSTLAFRVPVASMRAYPVAGRDESSPGVHWDGGAAGRPRLTSGEADVRGKREGRFWMEQPA